MSTTYAYNLDKQLTTVTRPDGKTISMGYDNGGRLSAITLPTGSISYVYNASTGNVMSVTAPNNETTGYTYDGSLVTSQSWTGAVNGSVGYVYNNDFRVASETVNGANTVGYTYDNDGQIVMAGGMSMVHDTQNGLLTGTTLAGITTANTYNTLGELTGYNASSGVTALYDAQYTRDNLGRITQKVETINGMANTYAYSYDTAGRLITVSKNNVVINSYTYDTNGNRLNNAAAYDAQDRLLTYGGNTYTYTANGELQSKINASGTTQYVYDVMGNLTSLTLPNGTLIEYIIDAQNRKIGKKVNGVLVQGFLYENQLNPVAELDGTGNVVSRFVYGTKSNVPDYMIKGGIMYRIISDNLGSPKLVVDATTGTIAQQMEYDEYGNVLSNSNPGFQPFGFAGGIYDRDTGLVRFGARDYDAESGRWTAKDPILFKGGDTNLYGYVVGDPVNLIDPFGYKQYTPNEKLCDGYECRIDEVTNTDVFEIHVFDPQGNEIGLYGKQGWFNKHGHKKYNPPNVPSCVNDGLKGKSLNELRRRKIAPDKGKANIKGENWLKYGGGGATMNSVGSYANEHPDDFVEIFGSNGENL